MPCGMAAAYTLSRGCVAPSQGMSQAGIRVRGTCCAISLAQLSVVSLLIETSSQPDNVWPVIS